MSNRTLTLKLIGFAVAMFAFGFMLVPLYDAFCAWTGLGGRTSSTPAQVSATVDPTRTVRVEFVATLGEYAPWEFRPDSSFVEVHPGELHQASFYARNLTDRPLTANAVPSVAPGVAARHLKKTECFCFTPQPFESHEERALQVVFTVDPELPEHLDTLTLSYTLYAARPL
jgi:cytochrome c oxidase assembly protein subunit 11